MRECGRIPYSCIDLIVRYDDSLRMKKNRQSNSYPRNNYNNKSVPSTQNRGNFRNHKPNWNRNKKSWKPQRKPFVKNNNWKPKDNNKPKMEKDLSNITCFNCNKKGHYANTCPEEKKAVTSCKWGLGLLKSRLCFLTSKKHKQDYKQRGTTPWG